MKKSSNSQGLVDYSPLFVGKPPDNDTWEAIYRVYYRWVRPVPISRALVRGYFLPRSFETWRKAAVYRFLGVAFFGRIVPTGGIAFRRITGARMVNYTLRTATFEGARRHLFRTCAIEAAHLAVFFAVSIAVVVSCLLGRTSLAIGGTVANLAINVYPVLLQRYIRARLVRVLMRRPRAAA